MEKIALTLHGWPQHDVSDHFLVKHLEKQGYKVISPNLFTNKHEFTIKNIERLIGNKLKKQKPSVIIGISLGGLLLPHIAGKYNTTRLIFIASGSKLASNSFLFNVLIKTVNIKLFQLIAEQILITVPEKYFVRVYQSISPFNGDEENRDEYERDMLTNLKYIRSIPLSKEAEIAKCVENIDNANLIKTLGNKSLIFNGENDLFMPVEEGRKLNKCLKNSELIIKKGAHFNVFARNDLKIVDEFLGN